MNQPINFDNLDPARLDLDDPPPSGTQRNRRVEGSHGGCSICAPAPLDDGLWSVRMDGGSAANRVVLRYAGERSSDTSASAGMRP